MVLCSLVATRGSKCDALLFSYLKELTPEWRSCCFLTSRNSRRSRGRAAPMVVKIGGMAAGGDW
jgi:hypothetical protein